MLARLFYLAVGLCLSLGAAAYGRLSIQRGYFVGKHGVHFRRGEPMYTSHLFLLGLGFCGGAGLAWAGILLPAGHPMLTTGYRG
jgi:hypothetical protein